MIWINTLWQFLKYEENYICDYCGKSYTISESLKYHIKTVYAGQWNHECDSCGKLFTQSGYLKKHINNVHDSPFERLS